MNFIFSDEKYFIFISARSFIHIPFTQVEFQIDPLNIDPFSE